MAYYLGIDGGGTKTKCVLAHEKTLLAEAMSGGSNIVRLGETQARDALQTVIHQVCTVAKISPNQISGICMGAAGAARPEIAAITREILAALMPEVNSANIEVVGDTEIAHEAAFGAGPGIIAIAGTGSIVYGRGVDGRIARAGGWGFAVSDEGSGHWIGRRAVAALLSKRDEGVGTELTAMVLQAWKLGSIDELVQQANSTPAPDFSRLFSVVLRTAKDGDGVALDLLSDAAGRLAGLVAIVMRRLVTNGPSEMLPVAVAGSVFRQSAAVRDVFYNTLQTNFRGMDVRLESVDPVLGALARARRNKDVG